MGLQGIVGIGQFGKGVKFLVRHFNSPQINL